MAIKLISDIPSPRQINLFQNIVSRMVRREVSDALVGVLLVCVGSMAGWPQLSRLEELERSANHPDTPPEVRSRLKQRFTDLATLIEDKARVAWFNETGEILRLK